MPERQQQGLSPEHELAAMSCGFERAIAGTFTCACRSAFESHAASAGGPIDDEEFNEPSSKNANAGSRIETISCSPASSKSDESKSQPIDRSGPGDFLNQDRTSLQCLRVEMKTSLGSRERP